MGQSFRGDRPGSEDESQTAGFAQNAPQPDSTDGNSPFSVSDTDPVEAEGAFNLKAPTLGGKQFWTDHHWRRGWRIQQNSLTHHWRLLDPNNVRHAWGSRVACQRQLDQLVPTSSLSTRKVIILLHGLMRSADSMTGLKRFLEQNLEVRVVNFEYASTQGAIAKHSAALDSVVSGLPENVDLAFVGHSMGNIIVRHYLGHLQRTEDYGTLDRIQEVVMLGPPNQGSSIARQLAKTKVFGWVVGRGGLELGPDWEQFRSKLAIPHCPFGIIAGHLTHGALQNPMVEGEGDYIVSVEETKLPGATDFLEVPRLHSFIMDDDEVQRAIKRFMETHSFRSTAF